MNRTLAAPMLVSALVLAVGLAGCSKKDEVSPHRSVAATAPAATQDAAAADKAAPVPAADLAAPRSQEKPAVAKSKPLAVTAPELAYAYQYGVEAPPAAVPMLVRLHESVCSAAGATNCQVVAANTTAVGKDDASGHLELRGEPNWLRGFRSRIEDDVKAAHGTLKGSQIETEDLSRSIVDTEAQLRAKKTLRDRMQNLLATHKGKLSDLVDLEQQVTQTQGQIDAAESELAVMKTRVATAKLTIDYRSSLALAPNSAFGRLSAAGHGFVRHFMDMVGFLLTLLSYFLPFGIVAGIGWWVFGKRRRPVVTTEG
ncbi:MAG: DUF4349 domain-containing protein [Proteobacteria bacterium]|nr:DUF4349 domain-containing protein [Pseudomonadota bacterium]